MDERLCGRIDSLRRALDPRVLKEAAETRSFRVQRICLRPVQPSHHFLQRSVWHRTQHVRQLQVVPDSYDVKLNRRIDESKYDGLPMPIAVWK